jgi:hypothetical protein
MGLAACVMLLLGTGIILGSEIKLHTISMTIIYAATCLVMVGLGYFGAGIVYGRGLEMKKVEKKVSVSAKYKAEKVSVTKATGKAQYIDRDSIVDPPKAP